MRKKVEMKTADKVFFCCLCNRFEHRKFDVLDMVMMCIETHTSVYKKYGIHLYEYFGNMIIKRGMLSKMLHVMSGISFHEGNLRKIGKEYAIEYLDENVKNFINFDTGVKNFIDFDIIE